MELELATLHDISEELGNRSSLGRLVFFHAPYSLLVSKDMSPKDLYNLAQSLITIASQGGNGDK